MVEQVSFTLRGRNPDVLTCIANLSNDEVFTPPELAGRMQRMVGFRNVAVHEYTRLNLDIVLTIITKHLDDFRTFSSTIVKACA